MIRVFVDASMLFAACYSASGASREIVRLGIQGKLTRFHLLLVRELAVLVMSDGKGTVKSPLPPLAAGGGQRAAELLV